MRFGKANHEQERLCRILLGLLEPADGLLGGFSILIGYVGHILRLGRSAFLAFGRRGIGRVRIGVAFRSPVRHGPREDIIVIAFARMVNLPDRLSAVAIFHECLAHGHGVGIDIAEVGGQVVDAECLRAQAQHEGVAGRGADGLVDIGPLK